MAWYDQILAFFQDKTSKIENAVQDTASLFQTAISQKQELPQDRWYRLDRFLSWNAENGTCRTDIPEYFFWHHLSTFYPWNRRQEGYFPSSEKYFIDILKTNFDCHQENGLRFVRRIDAINAASSVLDRSPLIRSLAWSFKSDNKEVRAEALNILPRVVRSYDDLRLFIEETSVQGWGRALRRAISDWFNAYDADTLLRESILKPRHAEWTLRELLHHTHPTVTDPRMRALFHWTTHRNLAEAIATARKTFPLIEGYYQIRGATDPLEVAAIIHAYELPYEMIPSTWLDKPEVWEALLEAMPLSTILSHLGRMTALGVLASEAPALRILVQTLDKREAIHDAGLSAFQILLALKIYTKPGRKKWHPIPVLVRALNNAVDLALPLTEPCNKRLLIAVDTSWYKPRTPHTQINATEANALLALSFMRTEKDVDLVSFGWGGTPISLAPHDTLDQAIEIFAPKKDRFTTLQQPIDDAIKRGKPYDAILILTARKQSPEEVSPFTQALKRYRRSINQQTKVVVVAADSRSTSIVPKNDPLILGCSGFDAFTPSIIGDFLRRE